MHGVITRSRRLNHKFRGIDDGSEWNGGLCVSKYSVTRRERCQSEMESDAVGRLRETITERTWRMAWNALEPEGARFRAPTTIIAMLLLFTRASRVFETA